MPRPRPTCVVCQHQASKYTCASCRAGYCSVACCKQHKEACSSGSTSTDTGTSASTTEGVPLAQDSESNTDTNPDNKPESTHPQDLPLQDPTPLRPLTTLKWPYVPDVSAYPDPLTRDDPKSLQLRQYEAIATSPTIRTLLANPNLCTLLTSIDSLRGAEREQALQHALGVDNRLLKNDDNPGVEMDENTRAFRAFSEAVERAVRGGREDMLGLDWDCA